jgi:hypothetical protein
LKLNALEPFASRRIIPSMRRLILAVMIVLLPLRGWIGDAMALEAATGTPAAIQSIAICQRSGPLHGPRAGNAVSPLHQRPASARPEATHFLTSLPVVRLPSGV